MKKNYKIWFFLLASVMALSLWGCGNTSPEASSENVKDGDFAALALDMESDTLKHEVTVKSFVDGDTSYFNVPEEMSPTGNIKVRYLAIDTPETSGKVEEYGKKASAFTREKLEKASSVILESDDDEWHIDSTGTRYLAWIWYRENEDEPYRNLNIEILQNGLAFGSSSANNRYGDTCMAALNFAKENKLNVFSGEKDPDFFYGDAIELTLKELRANIEEYNGKKVAFNGIVTRRNGNGVYVESYDADLDMYNGMYVYYGFTLADEGLDILSVGNEVRVVGTVSFYEAGDSYQVAGPSYRAMKPDDPDNIQKLGEGKEGAFVLTSADTFANGKVNVDLEGEMKEIPYAEMALGTTLEVKELHVDSVYTTSKEESSSNGAMTLECTCHGIPVTVRTVVLKDDEGNIIEEEAYNGKNINVKGIVDYFHGKYQIKVLSAKDITIL